MKANGPLLVWIFSDAAGVSLTDVRKIAGFVAAKRQIAHDADLAPGIIDEGQADRYSGCQRQAIEAALPDVCPAPRAFRGDGEIEALALAELGRQLGDLIGALSALDGDAAKTFRQGGQGPGKQAVLACPVDIKRHRALGRDADEEIPVRGVRIENDDRLGRTRRLHHQAPAEGGQQAARDAAGERLRHSIPWLAR